MERLNKPRVFLSHSSKDKKFIKKIYSDLIRCKTMPWLDEFEVRVGKPFMKVIFEEGIATCDMIIVYITDNSINSKFVEKEIDAALIQELGSQSIQVLLYLEKEELRKKLRLDLRTLQSKVWNTKNYSTLFPEVLSEIWLSYLEKSYQTSLLPIKKEKLELELELEKIRNDSAAPFSKQELIEFEYLFSLFNKPAVVEVNLEEDTSMIIAYTISTITFEINVIDFLIILMKESFARKSGIAIGRDIHFSVNMILYDRMSKQLGERINKNKLRVGNLLLKEFPYLELKASKLINIDKEILYFLDKMYRFYHWLNYKALIHENLPFKEISEKKFDYEKK
ncbi:MAG: toll/interleukin-1 receptor domain-containing protein [Ignavibacteriales bacterium]|nr:toll/interleukin-1 receptor domain-containing protein [Ignavibacteriales bacterium]